MGMERMEEDMGIFICGILCPKSVKRRRVCVVDGRVHPRGGDVVGEGGRYSDRQPILATGRGRPTCRL